jgi:hypothetical protein
MLDLVASFLWGTVGLAFVIYGKKAGEMLPMIIGLILMVLSYFLTCGWLTTVSVVLLGFYWLRVRGTL